MSIHISYSEEHDFFINTTSLFSVCLSYSFYFFNSVIKKRTTSNLIDFLFNSIASAIIFYISVFTLYIIIILISKSFFTDINFLILTRESIKYFFIYVSFSFLFCETIRFLIKQKKGKSESEYNSIKEQLKEKNKKCKTVILEKENLLRSKLLSFEDIEYADLIIKENHLNELNELIEKKKFLFAESKSFNSFSSIKKHYLLNSLNKNINTL